MRPRMTCGECKGKGWAIHTRKFSGKFPDLKGRKQVQRCERCGTFGSDVEAATIAKKTGVRCLLSYPCIVDEPAEADEPS